jgi:hypothetical protein
MGRKNLKSKIDWYIILRVKEMRSMHARTQEDIALHLDFFTGFIGHIESPKFSAKYNANHLNDL